MVGGDHNEPRATSVLTSLLERSNQRTDRVVQLLDQSQVAGLGSSQDLAFQQYPMTSLGALQCESLPQVVCQAFQ
jgi:hypothetical protein